jgi:hypothetical protein
MYFKKIKIKIKNKTFIFSKKINFPFSIFHFLILFYFLFYNFLVIFFFLIFFLNFILKGFFFLRIYKDIFVSLKKN